MIEQILMCIQCCLGLFLVSTICSMYMKVSIIAVPSIILYFLDLCSRYTRQQISRSSLYRAFPWLGIYAYTLERNESSSQHLVSSFMLLLVLSYAVFVISMYLNILMLFKAGTGAMPAQIEESFLGSITLLEFGTMLFIRTRTAIKYFPKITVVLLLSFLVYVQNTLYGFYYLYFYFVLIAIGALFFYLITTIEIPALTWNSGYSYTPTQNRPRTLYFPLFSLNAVNDLPNIWSQFYPLHGRSFFTNQQLSFVDQRISDLNQMLSPEQGVVPADNPQQIYPDQPPQPPQPLPRQNVQNEGSLIDLEENLVRQP